jgi:hypothetical protein
MNHVVKVGDLISRGLGLNSCGPVMCEKHGQALNSHRLWLASSNGYLVHRFKVELTVAAAAKLSSPGGKVKVCLTCLALTDRLPMPLTLWQITIRSNPICQADLEILSIFKLRYKVEGFFDRNNEQTVHNSSLTLYIMIQWQICGFNPSDLWWEAVLWS